MKTLDLFLKFRQSLMAEGKSRGAVLWPYSRLSSGHNLPEFLISAGIADPRSAIDTLVNQGKIIRTPWRGPSGRKGVLLSPATEAATSKGGRKGKSMADSAQPANPQAVSADLESIIMEVLRRLKA